MRSDAEILHGFLDGDSQAFRELLIRFQRAFLRKIWINHRALWTQRADVLDAAETRLLEWRRIHRAGETRFHPGELIQELAWRIAKQEAELFGVSLKHEESVTEYAKQTEPTRLRPPRADDGARYMDLLKQIDSLSPEVSEVLQAEAERSENGGPPLDEVLGISPAAARKRLERARRQLVRLRRAPGEDEEYKYSNAGEPRQGEEEEEEDDDGWE